MKALFSVVMATRDRPELFGEALASVLEQERELFEVIVVNDGSSAACVERYEPVWARAREQLGDRLQVHTLVHRPRGHGQSYALNFGASRAGGEYLCFLDDDDRWTDRAHLAGVASAVSRAHDAGRTADLCMSNQEAWAADGRRVGVLWLGTLAAELAARGRQADGAGVYTVTVADLMQTTGFCHLNCLVVRRAVFESVDGMDEGIRWECDRDLYLKLIEASNVMLHDPRVMAYHRVPDPRKTTNMTTAMGMIEKRLQQLAVLDRAYVRSRHPLIKDHARRHKGYALKKIALEFAAQGNWPAACSYARQALGVLPSLKWRLFTARCQAQAWLSPREPA